MTSGYEEQKKQENFVFYVIPYAGPEKVELELVLKNEGDEPILFEFLTSQKYDIKVIDSKGEEVYVFSEGKMFTQALEKVKLKEKEQKRWTVSWDYQYKNKRVEEGDYKVKAALTSVRINEEPVKKREALYSEAEMHIPSVNPVFQDISVKGQNGSYSVKGKARPTQGKMYYTVEDGHQEYISETEIKIKSKYPEWETFDIKVEIDKEKLPKNATLILNLYERSEKEEMILHTYPVILQNFY